MFASISLHSTIFRSSIFDDFSKSLQSFCKMKPISQNNQLRRNIFLIIIHSVKLCFVRDSAKSFIYMEKHIHTLLILCNYIWYQIKIWKSNCERFNSQNFLYSLLDNELWIPSSVEVFQYYFINSIHSFLSEIKIKHFSSLFFRQRKFWDISQRLMKIKNKFLHWYFIHCDYNIYFK